MHAILLVSSILTMTLVSAFPVEDLTKLSIVKTVETVERELNQDTVQVSSGERTEVIQGFSLSRGRVTAVGISCIGFCDATLSYDVTIDGVSSEFLSSSDGLFRSALNSSQIGLYDESLSSYGGGLDVPFLRAVGINLDAGFFSNNSVNQAAAGLQNYNELANAAQTIVNSFEGATVRLNGTMRVKSFSPVRSESNAFIKFARVTLLDDSEIRVVSANAADVTVSSSNGGTSEVVDFTGGAVQQNTGNPLLRSS